MLSVAPIGTGVVLSVVSIAMSVERYADTATESITRSRILLAAKSKRTPRLRIQGRGVLLASVIRPSLSKTDDFNRIGPRIVVGSDNREVNAIGVYCRPRR